MPETDLSSFDRGVFLVNVVAIIYKDGKILIGRVERDQHVKELSWVFPGGRPVYEKPLEDSLRDEVKKKTGLDVDVKQLIFSRIPPELTNQILLYYYAEPVGGKEKAGEKFVEIKWVKPTEIKKYSTTSVHPKIMEFLKNLEKK